MTKAEIDVRIYKLTRETFPSGSAWHVEAKLKNGEAWAFRWPGEGTIEESLERSGLRRESRSDLLRFERISVVSMVAQTVEKALEELIGAGKPKG